MTTSPKTNCVQFKSLANRASIHRTAKSNFFNPFTRSVLKYWIHFSAVLLTDSVFFLCFSPFYSNTPFPSWRSSSENKVKLTDEQQMRQQQEQKKRSMTAHLCLTSLLFLSISARSCVPRRELKMVFGRQTTSFRRASVISCGISGLDVPPQISRPSREACGSRQAAFPIIVLNC